MIESPLWSSGSGGETIGATIELLRGRYYGKVMPSVPEERAAANFRGDEWGVSPAFLRRGR